MLTVKEVSKQLEMSPHTVCFYCDNDLIPNLKRDKNNVRQFDDDAVAWLFVVKYLRNCGMSLKAIKEYIELCLFGNSTIQKRQRIVKQQREKIELQLNQLRECAKYLDDKFALYEKALKQGMEADLTNPNQWERHTDFPSAQK